jgi:hypothetical protein
MPDDGPEPVKQQAPGALPADPGLRAYLPDRGFGGQVGEPGPVIGQHMVDPVRAQAGAEEQIEPAVADHAEVVAQADLPCRPVASQRLRDRGQLRPGDLLLEVVARDHEEGVEPEREEELHQPRHDVTRGQAGAELGYQPRRTSQKSARTGVPPCECSKRTSPR